MTEAAQVQPSKWRKVVFQAVVGMICGAAGMSGLLWLLDGQAVRTPDASVIVAAGVGLIYFITGLFVGAGALMPGLGARLLNVADREELIEQRAMLGGSAVAMTLLGAVLVALAASHPSVAIVPPMTAFWAFVAAMAVSTVISARMWPSYDELWRALVRESSAMFAYLVFAVLALWGAAAAVGLIAGPGPLDLLSLAFGGFLLASFIAVGQRGMMLPT
jgi:hypothetical protein